MLDRAFIQKIQTSKLILHSDQGWQYQHNFYTKRLEEKNIIHSMLRKGNSLYNGLMESFFGIMKSEIFYGQENNYKKIAIEEYIDFITTKELR